MIFQLFSILKRGSGQFFCLRLCQNALVLVLPSNAFIVQILVYGERTPKIFKVVFFNALPTFAVVHFAVLDCSDQLAPFHSEFVLQNNGLRFITGISSHFSTYVQLCMHFYKIKSIYYILPNPVLYSSIVFKT